MDATRRPSFKVCCIQTAAEAKQAIAAGAAALGLVSEMPSGPGVIDDRRATEIAAAVPDDVETFLLTSRREPEAIVEQHREIGATAIQIVDELPPGGLTSLRGTLPEVRLIQVIHVVGPEALGDAECAAEAADAVLLDSGRPKLAVKELGGTGRRHDWEISARIREQLEIPVILAGGLDPDNVGEAIEIVRPSAVDVCSGLRDDDFRLDDEKLRRFAAAVGEAPA